MAGTCEHCVINVKTVQLSGGGTVYNEKILHIAHAVKENAHAVKEHKP